MLGRVELAMLEGCHEVDISFCLLFDLLQEFFLVLCLLFAHGSSSLLILVVLPVHSDQIPLNDSVKHACQTLGVLGQNPDAVFFENIESGF